MKGTKKKFKLKSPRTNRELLKKAWNQRKIKEKLSAKKAFCEKNAAYFWRMYQAQVNKIKRIEDDEERVDAMLAKTTRTLKISMPIIPRPSHPFG